LIKENEGKHQELIDLVELKEKGRRKKNFKKT